jgi:hypothetical protein
LGRRGDDFARAIAFEIGTMSPGDSPVDQSKNLEPQMNADERK